jgi:hypothetical protein
MRCDDPRTNTDPSAIGNGACATHLITSPPSTATVLFVTAAFRRNPHAEDMRIVRFSGDLVGGALMVLGVPIAILAVVPVTLVVGIVLSAVGLL